MNVAAINKLLVRIKLLQVDEQGSFLWLQMKHCGTLCTKRCEIMCKSVNLVVIANKGGDIESVVIVCSQGLS